LGFRGGILMLVKEFSLLTKKWSIVEYIDPPVDSDPDDTANDSEEKETLFSESEVP
jgi:hypothetical protein